MTYKTGDTLELRTGISEKLREKLARIRDLLSKEEVLTISQTLEQMADIALEKIDPLPKKPTKLKSDVLRRKTSRDVWRERPGPKPTPAVTRN